MQCSDGHRYHFTTPLHAVLDNSLDTGGWRFVVVDHRLRVRPGWQVDIQSIVAQTRRKRFMEVIAAHYLILTNVAMIRCRGPEA